MGKIANSIDFIYTFELTINFIYMAKDLQGNCMHRRIQAYPSISTFKIIQSIASIKGLSVAKVASDILSGYCNQMTLSERESLIKRYDSSQEAN